MLVNLKSLAFLFFIISIIATCVEGQASFRTASDYSANIYVKTNISRPRGILLDDAGDILVVSTSTQPNNGISAVHVQNNEIMVTQILNAANLGLNHGIAYNLGFLYASNANTVFRWPYAPGERKPITTDPEVVIQNIPDGGDHVTRTLIFDRNNMLYVSVGSAENVELNSTRSRIRRFNVGEYSGSFEFSSGEVFAARLRNPVGLAVDTRQVLWGLDCGADNLTREDLGVDIHKTNPADELIRFDQPAGTSYGYPYCWTVDKLANCPRGQQLSWPGQGFTDEDCITSIQNTPPTLALPAHQAAIGITFYDGTSCDGGDGAFPCSMKGDAFIAFHGSANVDPPVGYKVARVPFNSTGFPTGEVLDVMYEPDLAGCKDKCFRPVDLAFDGRGHLIVTADATNEVFRITYGQSDLSSAMRASHFSLGILFMFSLLHVIFN